MEIIVDIDVTKQLPGCIATIGVFDGVHRGHQHLISMVTAQAERCGAASMVITFDRQPRQVFDAAYQPQVLSTLDEKRDHYDVILSKFFDAHPNIHHCITFNSKAHLVGEFLLRSNRRNIQIMGYDMVPKNADCVRQGSISFLIAQHAYMQGYACVETLFRAIVLKKEVEPVNYMPIELLTKENIDYYRRTNIG